MGETEIIYSNERETWNVFHNGEWYYESKNYEQANEVYSYLICPIEDDYYGDDGDENYYPEEEYDYE